MERQEFVAIEDGVLPRFYVEAVHNAATGKFENVEFVEIIIPGDNKTVVVHEVQEHHRNRFKNVYKAFQEGRTMADVGTALDKLGGLDPASIATLKYLHIHSIEALAEVGDNVLPNIGMGAREMRERARKYLQANYVDTEKEELKSRLAALEAKLSAKEPLEEAPKPRGRPPAVRIEEDVPPHMKGE
jgi:hypothetical protein